MSNRRFPLRVRGSVARWLRAEPRAVVTFSVRSARDGAERPGATSGGDLADGLLMWRRAVVRARFVVVARRALTAALALAVLLLLVRLVAGSLPAWLVVALPVLALGVVLSFGFATGGPSLAQVAQLLDRRLGLAERLGTAWELTEAGSRTSPLARRVIAQADDLVWALTARQRVRPRHASGEWSALGVGIVAAAVLLAVGAPGGSGGARSLAAQRDIGGSAGGADRTTTGPTAPGTRTTSTPSATSTAATTLPGARPGTPGSSGTQTTATTPAAPGAAGAGRAATKIAVRQQPPGGAKGGAANGQGGATGTSARGGVATKAAPHSETTTGPPTPGSVPPPNHVRGIPAQGQHASHPVSSGASNPGSQHASGAGAAHAGSRGAGKQSAGIGRSGAQSSGHGGTSQSLPLRTVATSGGREQGGGAGRAGTGGNGRGAAHVEHGGGAGGGTAGSGTAPTQLSFVPTGVNVVAPSLRDLVSAYFPLR